MAAAAVWQRQQMCGVGSPVASAWQYQHGSVIAVAGQRKCGIVSVQAAEAGTPHLRYGAAGSGGGDRRPTRRAAPTPRTPRAAPVPPLATLRYGAARAAGGLPEGPPLLSKT